MIIIMKPNASGEAVKKVTNLTESEGLTAHLSKGSQVTIVGVIGDKTRLLDTNIEISEGVDKIVAVTESYKSVNEKLHPEGSVIPVGNTHIGPGTVIVMTDPCVIESLDQLLETAYAVRKAGVTLLRSGACRPRISPYSSRGLEEEGLKYIKAVREATGLSVTCEVAGAHATEPAVKYVDMLRTGTRNMQNFESLKEAGKSGTPVLLKRDLCATVDEWLGAVEYIIPEGNPNIVLCERDTRTYGVSTRNALDISAVPVIRQKNHLSIIVDPSHATGVRAYMEPLAEVAIAVGADGLIIEVHLCPAKVLSDGPQSLAFGVFGQLMKDPAPYVELPGQTFKTQ